MELGISRTMRVAAIALRTTPPDHDAYSDSMLRLSSGLLIVGTARFVCALGDYVSSLLQTTRFTISLRIHRQGCWHRAGRWLWR